MPKSKQVREITPEERKQDKEFLGRRDRLAKYWPSTYLPKMNSRKGPANELPNQLFAVATIWRDLIINACANIMLVTVDGEICFVGNSSEGFDSQKVVGYRWHDFVPPDQLPEMLAHMRECVENRQTVRYELTTFTADRRDLIYFANVIWPVIENGEVIGIMSYSTDISEQKRAELRILQSSQMAAMGEILGAITHEINNPLTVIALSIESTINANQQSEYQSAAVARHANMAKQATSRVLQMVNTIRNLFRPAGSTKEKFSINESFQELKVLVESRFRTAGIDLRIVGGRDEISLAGDINAFSHCLLNLLNNAFDAVKGTESPWVELACRVADGSIQISVTDSGKMSPEIESRVFSTRFTTKARGQGTGLGLSLCKRIVTDMGGKIELDNQCPNTKFIIMLKPYSESNSIAA